MLLDKIVVGSSIESAYYALANGSVFVDTKRAPALFCKKLSTKILNENFEAGAWQKTNILLGLLSKRIVVGPEDTAKISENKLKIIRGTSVFEYDFSEAVIFDPTWVNLENEIFAPRKKSFLTIDDFELSTLGPKRYELPPLIQDESFASELHFYSSNRVDGSKYITDCVLISELTQDELNCFDYSDSIGKIVIERYLASIGVFGTFMKYNLNGTRKYRKPKVVHVRRMPFERDNNLYEDSDSVSFLNLTLEQIIEAST
jgi:hypothetical protein